jgi:hypothetical protein
MPFNALRTPDVPPMIAAIKKPQGQPSNPNQKQTINVVSLGFSLLIIIQS